MGTVETALAHITPQLHRALEVDDGGGGQFRRLLDQFMRIIQATTLLHEGAVDTEKRAVAELFIDFHLGERGRSIPVTDVDHALADDLG
jgi:hypothetical protein